MTSVASRIDVVTRTKAFSPSKIARALECPLRYILETEHSLQARIPETLAGCLGKAAHSAIHAFANNPAELDAGAFRTAIGNEFLRLALAIEGARWVLEALEVPKTIPSLLPVPEFIDRVRIAMRCAQNARAVGARRRPSVPGGGTAFEATAHQGADDREFGTEISLSSRSLDVSGRADLIERQADGTIRITEFKTGFTAMNGDSPTQAALIQVCTYALVQAERTPRVAIVVRVVASNGEWERPFTRDLGLQALNALQTARERLPRDAHQLASDLASPGEVCMHCRFRPTCSRYLEWGSARWHVGASRLPLDAWGELESIDRVSDLLANVRLRDPAGRSVRIVNVPKQAMLGATLGGRLEAFGLASREVGRGMAFPCNFHVADRHRSFRSAFSAQINAQN